MKGKNGEISLVMLTLLSLSLIGSQLLTITEAEPTRAMGEHLEIDVTVDFNGPLDYDVSVVMEIYEIYFNGTILNSDEIRSLYSMEPGQTLETIEEDLNSRAENLTSSSFQGDSIEVVNGNVTISTLDNATNHETDPVVYTMTLHGETDISRYLDPQRAELIGEGREDFFVTSLFLSGFVYQRSISLIALEGEIVTYNIPSGFDPLGDGSVELSIGSFDHTPSGGYYTIIQDGMGGRSETYFTLLVRDESVMLPSEELIDGTMLVDWTRLDTMSVEGSVDIHSIDASRSGLLNSVPASMSVPSFIGGSFIRYAHLEGILTEADMDEIEDQIEDEVETPLRDALNDQNVGSSAELITGSGGMELPSTGEELRNVLDSAEPVTASIETDSEIQLDILKDYQEADVIGLLNGGFRIAYDLDPINDDRFSLNIRTPEHILFRGETPLETEADRRTYQYQYGRKLIASDLAPQIDGEILSITGFIDISQIRSWYLADIEMDVDANLTFGLGAMEFNSDEFELDTELEVELDYLTSDIVRLLMDMEIIDRQEIEDNIENDLRENIEDLLPDEDDSFFIDIDDDSLNFDGDRENMNGEEPLILQIGISGTISPMKLIQGSDDEENAENQILPFHLDPIIPFRTFKDEIDLEGASNWTLDVELSIPSGIGLKAWLVKDDVKVKDLEVDTSEGYPTLHIDISPGEADAVGFEISFGSYLVVNNIGACFACCVIGLVMILLMVLLIILKIARKKKDKKGGDQKNKGKKEKNGKDEKTEEENEGTEEENEGTEEENDDEEMDWD